MALTNAFTNLKSGACRVYPMAQSKLPYLICRHSAGLAITESHRRVAVLRLLLVTMHPGYVRASVNALLGGVVLNSEYGLVDSHN